MSVQYPTTGPHSHNTCLPSILSRLSSSPALTCNPFPHGFHAIGMTCVFTKYENENSVLPMDIARRAIVEDVLATRADACDSGIYSVRA